MSTELSMRMKTVHAVFNSYRTLSVASLLEPLAGNFTCRVLPQSLKRDKKAFASHAAQIYSIFTRFAMEPQSVFEDTKNNVVFIHTKMVGELNSFGLWEDEALLMMGMSEDGTKVVGMERVRGQCQGQGTSGEININDG